jgi:hypothetical protein
MSVVAQQKHRGFLQAIGHDRAERNPVKVGRRSTARVFMAELQSGGSAERMSHGSNPRKIQPAGKCSGGRVVQLLKVIDDRLRIGYPHRQESADEWIGEVAVGVFDVVGRRATDYAAIGLNDDERPGRRIESDNNVAMTSQILCQRGEVGCEGAPARAQQHDRIRPLLGRDWSVWLAMGAYDRGVALEKRTHEGALAVAQGFPPRRRHVVSGLLMC